MVVAERKRSLSGVLEYYQERGANTSKIINKCVPNRQVRNHTKENPEKGKPTFEANQEQLLILHKSMYLKIQNLILKTAGI